MVINPNAQAAARANTGAAIHARPHPTRNPAEAQDGSEDESVATISPRSTHTASSSVPPVSDADGAMELTEFVRHHILSRPAASIAVQANSRPQAVFDLLDGIFE